MKYKLVKTYPLCPFELGAVATDENVKSDVMLCIRTDVGRYTTYPKEAIVNNPEFWEEVKEKEYTILSFISPNGVIRTLRYNGKYTRDDKQIYFALEFLLASDKIHSVRRESDGEVFQLGDIVYPNENKDRTTKIEWFDTSGPHLILNGDSEGFWDLQWIKKAPVRKPILVTEDGVEIFEGDMYYWIDEVHFEYKYIFNASKPKLKGKCFSTKEKAEEYIKWNKPMYSLNDIMDACMDTDGVIGRLEKLGRK